MINLSHNKNANMKKDFLMTRRMLFTSLCFISACFSLSAQSINNPLTVKTDRSVDFTYNALGLLTRIDGPRTDVQDIISYEYDNQGRLTKTINALGHTTEILAYSALGEPLSIKNKNGVITSLTYNGFGWLTSIEINNRVTRFEYDALAQITKTTLPNNSFIAYEYDDAHRLIAISDNQGNRVEYQLDLAGNQLSANIKNATGTLTSTQQNVFDELSRLRTATNGEGDNTHFDYNKNNTLTKQTDALSNVTQHSYDALGRLTQTTDANNGNTSFAYDKANRISRVTDAENKATDYKTTGFDEQIKRNSPDSGTSRYAYDNAGNMTSKIDARGVTTQYQYDALSRVSAITYTNKKENIYFKYDETTNNNKGIGKLTQVINNSGKIQLIYDANGQLTKEFYQIQNNNNQQNYTTSYQYHNNSVMSGITYPSGRQVNYTLNSLGLIHSVTTQSPTEVQHNTVISNATYLPFGPVATYTYGNGLVATRNYDLEYRITGDNLTSLKQQTISYSKVGNITGITDSINTNNNQTLTYNKLSQLTHATGSYGELSYSYDKIGNRLAKTIDSQNGLLTNDYTYKADNHHLEKISQTTANLSSRYISRFNQAGRLSELTSTNQKTQYSYNYRGLRVSKNNNNENTHYHYDPSGRLLAESTAQGHWQKEYLYFNNQLVAVVDYTHNANGVLFYVHTDYLGTPKIATNATKSIVWQANYTPFGLATVNEDVDNNGITFILNVRFPGQYYDKESTLHYNWFRYYDPESGRYVHSDPIGLAGGINTYGYVEGNPVGFIDPYGLCSCPTNLASNALLFTGDTKWAYGKKNGDFDKETNKCNQFVSNMVNWSGGDLPEPNGWFGGNPLVAGQWGDPSYKIEGWSVVQGIPQPGDIIAIKAHYSDATGHVAIVTGKGQSTSAAKYSILTNDWGYRVNQSPVIRRCSCTP